MDKYLPIKRFMDENGIGYRENVTGSECTTFKLGGAVPLFAEPANQKQAEKLLSFVTENDIAFFVIGNGSNLLITDSGCDCLFIKLSGELVEYRIENGMLICGAGASLAAASRASVLAGYMGLEWATGIPGTIGGAVAMNAGAYGGEIKQALKSVKVFCNDGVIEMEADKEAMGYRKSPYAYPNMVVLEAVFELREDDGGARERMEDFSARRRDKQPLNYPSAGSFFKRPEGNFAGALIEQAGLKGFRVGGAMVSEKHAGFLINYSDATASDVLALMAEVERIVYERFGVQLEPEVKII